jgi:hypothetical protein
MTKINLNVRRFMAKEKGRQWDGISRPSDDNYRKEFDRIFKKEKTLHEELMEGYEEEKKELTNEEE